MRIPALLFSYFLKIDKMINYDPDLNATKHFLTDYEDCPDLSVELEQRVVQQLDSSQIVPVIWRPVIDEDDLPHSVIATTWRHFNQDGVLTRKLFLKRLHEALDSLAGQIIKNGGFRPYPMTRKPAVTTGHAYHDYNGADIPIDVRLVITYGQIPLPSEEIVYGLSFHIVTLVEKGSHKVS